ncbi:TPA: hypothetical protein QCY38_004461 [Bacillus toyonensis]|uniref:hypothetical protein n=1 Tax=Bacillus sp. 2SH TaxID=2502202 RepID=UPI0010F97A5D|nr:hypothetical protein [Bacillus sp. 2SH]HDR7950715.1 hypothetical protein [Bacillus toyonensis]
MTKNEVKGYLDISHFIFNNLMKQGKLTPINKDTWRLDGSFLFSREEVEKVNEERKIEGIILYQASKEYHISMNQLEKWIDQRFVQFRFPKSERLRNNIFHIIDNILQYVSPRNIKISEEETFWYFEIRQSLITLPPGIQMEWIEELTPYIIEGKIVSRMNQSVYLDSNTVTKFVILTSKEYKYMKEITSETNSSIEEFIAVAIRDKINQHLRK